MPRGRPRKKSMPRSTSASPIMESPKKRLKWSDESMAAAMNAVSQGCSINRAAMEHGVPRSTLQYRISCRVQHGFKPGPKPYLNKLEEGYPGGIITKYQFNEIFSTAWLKSVVPANIISGFKTCRIYPFNPKGVLDHDPCELKISKPKSSDTSQCYSSEASSSMQCESSTADNSSHSVADTFTPEEEARFIIQYNEGCDLPDPRYLSWLQLNHPEQNFQALIELFPDVAPLDPINASAMYSSHCSDSTSPSILSIGSLSADPVVTINDITPSLTPSHGSYISSPRTILSSLSTHPISSNTDIIPGSTTAVFSCGSDVGSPSNISTKTNTTPNSISSHFSHSSDATSPVTVSNYSPSTLPVCPTTDTTPSSIPSHSSLSSTNTSSSVTSKVGTDAISKYLVQYVSPPPAK